MRMRSSYTYDYFTWHICILHITTFEWTHAYFTSPHVVIVIWHIRLLHITHLQIHITTFVNLQIRITTFAYEHLRHSHPHVCIWKLVWILQITTYTCECFASPHTHMNTSHHLIHIWMLHITHFDVTRHTYGFVTSHAWMRSMTLKPWSGERVLKIFSTKQLGFTTLHYFYVTSHSYDASHDQYCVMSHTWMGHVTRLNSSSHTNIYKRDILHMNAACHTHKCVTSHTWVRRITHRNDACHAQQWCMSHIEMMHVTHERLTECVMSHMNKSCHRWNESCHIWLHHVTYDCITSHLIHTIDWFWWRGWLNNKGALCFLILEFWCKSLFSLGIWTSNRMSDVTYEYVMSQMKWVMSHMTASRHISHIWTSNHGKNTSPI